MVLKSRPTVIWLEKSLTNSNAFASQMRSSARSAISIVGAMMCGRSERRAGATRKLVDHISLRGRERFPVARRLHDVVVAREDPELAALAPVTGILLAQDFVVRKGIGIDGRRVEIECVHRAARKSRFSSWPRLS